MGLGIEKGRAPRERVVERLPPKAIVGRGVGVVGEEASEGRGAPREKAAGCALPREIVGLWLGVGGWAAEGCWHRGAAG